MQLLSLQFILLVAMAVLAYYALGRVAPAHQWKALLAASVIFYVCAASVPALVLMLATSLDVWGASLLLARISEESKAARKGTRDRKERKAIKARYDARRRRVFWAALAVPFLILGYFKYLNVVLFNFGLAETPSSLHILLPFGISYYSFQALSYLIDSYNEKFDPEPSFARLLLFVSWFPQIAQGPIGRYADLAPQLVAPRRPDTHAMRKGLLTCGYGLFKTFAIANVLFHNVRSAFATINDAMPGSLVVYGVLCYSIEMYANFSGGIDIVEGVSELFGVEMAQNFRQPYFATSLADFWRRWHMSLGSWMRDYVFYPIALTRPMQAFGKWARAHLSTHVGRTLPACVANVIVFLFVGLWHGAEWHYVIWGLYNGAIVALSDLLAPLFQHIGDLCHVRRESAGYHAFAVLRTFLVVNLGRYFDCVTDIGDSLICLRNTFTNFMPIPFGEILTYYGVPGAEVLGFSRVVFICLVLVAVVSWFKERGLDVRARILAAPLPLRLLLYGLCTAIVLYEFDFTFTSGGAFLYANY